MGPHGEIKMWNRLFLVVFTSWRVCHGAESWGSVTASYESCDAHGKCVEGAAAAQQPASQLVKERKRWNRDTWKSASAKMSGDYLVIFGQVVMDTSEAPYMKKLAEVAGAKGGRIMETGFGMGISATFLQNHTGIKEHVVIEANQGVFAKKLLPFAANYSSVRPMYGFFQDVTPLLQSNSFDAVPYDTFPMDDDDISNPLC